MKDMLSSEKPAKMLKVAKQKGFSDLAQKASYYIIHPTLGKAKSLLDISKEVYHSLVNSAIEKPQIMFTWEKAVNALKKGDFKVAEKSFDSLEKEIKQVEKTSKSQKEKAFKRFREHQKKKKANQ